MRGFSRLLALLALAGAPLSATQALGHESWLSPDRYQVQSGEQVTARIRVGQNFKGATYSYFPNRVARLDLIDANGVQVVNGRVGDDPAVAVTDVPDGLAIVVHETTDSTLRYNDWQKFVDFVEHKQLEDTLAAHKARGLPETGFRETYRRFAKSLIAVGDGAGADRAVGLRTEIVAGANPYTDDMTGGMPVTVLFEGAPRAGAQVEVYVRPPEGDVEVALYTTDAAGQALIDVAPAHDYMVDAVKMLPLEPSTPTDAVWISLWANLTFRVP